MLNCLKLGQWRPSIEISNEVPRCLLYVRRACRTSEVAGRGRDSEIVALRTEA